MNLKIQTKLLYQQEQLPIFQHHMYDTETAATACPRGDMCLVENLETGLVYNAAFRPELMVYDVHYQSEQAVSPLFHEHLESVTKIVRRTMGQKGLIEIGCGKGYFLEMLLDQGVDVTGFDPSYEGLNTRVERRYFEPGLDIKANGLIMRHVLEHIQNPVNFLMRLKEANSGSGLIYIEVPCFDWICSHRAWFDIFYEHVNYFRLADFFRMFDSIIESGRLFGSQYIYVVAELASLKIPKYEEQYCINFPKNFLGRLEEQKGKNDASAIWGGASKGVIFALFKQRAGISINTVIDINPSKQGKFLPATGLKVQSPVDALPRLRSGATIWVMNSNYLEEIKSMSRNVFNYQCIDQE